MQPQASSNGFSSRRGEREGVPRLENKRQSGKSDSGRSINAVEGFASSSDILVYLSTCLIGHPVEVQLKNGSMYCGTCHTINAEEEFGIVLKMAYLTKDVSFKGKKPDSVSKMPSKTLIIPGKDIVQVMVKDLPITMEGVPNDLQHANQQELMIDSVISQTRHVDVERELKPWVPDEDIPQCPELENTFDGHRNRGWNQFETNEKLFGVKSTFDEELYTTKLERGPQMRELEKEAGRIAREIEDEETQDLHLADERGVFPPENFDVDEETRFSSVSRSRVADDAGYDGVENVTIDSCNTETLGLMSASKESTDLTHQKSDDGARVSSSFSTDEAHCLQTSTSADLYHPGSYGDTRSSASRVHSKSSSDCKNRIQENPHSQHGRLGSIKETVREHKLADDAQFLNSEDSQSLPNGKKDNSEKERLSSNAAADASHVYSKSHQKAGTPAEPSVTLKSSKGAGGVQSRNSCGQPDRSTSSNLDYVAVSSSVSSGPGLSPSSSVGSLTSEKSTLNPHAKEFKLNPNAKSFTPSQTHVRPSSPMSEGSFYYPANVSAMPHMHGVPEGSGVGPSFSGHHPVIFNPQVAPLQTSQAYFHPSGPQYAPQMFLGHPRQVMYMPNYYQPEMPYKGRQF